MFKLKFFINLALGLTVFASQQNNTRAESLANVPDNSSALYFKELLSSLEELKGEMSFADEQTEPVTKSLIEIRGNVLEENRLLLKRMSLFAGASYCINLNLRLWTCLHCINLGRQVELIDIYSDFLTGTKAFLALDHEHKSINVVFRGSSNIRNWIGNLNYNMVEYEGVPHARVHAGFLQCIDALKRKILPDLRDQIQYRPTYKVSIIGHSLGGAIAALAALEFRRTLTIPDSQLRLVSYGEPRIGNGPFADYFTNQTFQMLRVVHNHDMVPHVPPTSFDFFHRRRMIYSNLQNLYECQPDNWSDNTCTLAQKIGTSIFDHLNYFNTYLGVGC